MMHSIGDDLIRKWPKKLEKLFISLPHFRLIETEDSSVCPWLLWLATDGLEWPWLAQGGHIVLCLTPVGQGCWPWLWWALLAMVGERPWTPWVGMNHGAVSDWPKCGYQIAENVKILVPTSRSRLWILQSQQGDWVQDYESFSDETKNKLGWAEPHSRFPQGFPMNFLYEICFRVFRTTWKLKFKFECNQWLSWYFIFNLGLIS